VGIRKGAVVYRDANPASHKRTTAEATYATTDYRKMKQQQNRRAAGIDPWRAFDGRLGVLGHQVGVTRLMGGPPR
jgi:hypothetical protein